MKSTEQEIKEFEQMNKERLERSNKNDTLNQANTKYNHKNSRIAEDKPKSSHDDHNTMMNLISNNISNPRVVHNRSRSRSNANKLNFSNSSNSLSKFTKENNNLNKDKGNTDELNIVSKPTISHSTSVFEITFNSLTE
ncbi:FH2 domain-containing protein 1, variant 3 [Schistosoma haematobium]|uniref:FH2 domain-containing protein 1, variant 3 n=1 Tax=Schistosoma haematobium TaxID=6185 RepID=A0A922LGD1_SCHHA|nr:FH2 domain-containing protein 1, variant 3 [Schistosoma haematobium]KAH9583113.1 FH2 domain-containing protein 1, variant 3 [Schistosoma haematobium]